MDFAEAFAATFTSPTTRKTYRNRVRRYVEAVDPLTITTGQFAAWFTSVTGPSAPATVASMLGTYRSFHRWLIDEQLRDDSPVDVDAPRVEADPPAPPPTWKVLAMIDALDVTPAAIASLMYGSALRVETALSIRLEDLQLAERRVWVVGKGNKRRMLPFPTGTAQRLERYLEQRGDVDSPWLFNGDRERITGHMSYTWFVRRLAETAERLGWPPEEWTRTHLFRHACGTDLMRRDVHLRKLQRLLTHSSSKQTERYLHAAVDDLAAAIDEHHPLSTPRRRTAGVFTTPARVSFAWAG